MRLPSLVATCVITRYWDRAEEQAWFELYGPLMDDASFHRAHSHAGYVPDHPHQRRGVLPPKVRDWIYKKVRCPCPYPWDALFLLSDGTMSVCSSDFDARVDVGRYPESSVRELWEGQKMRSLRKAHMGFDFRDWTTCESCDVTAYGNRLGHHRHSQRIKRRNGFRARTEP